MNRKTMPLVLMLIAGAVTSIMTFIMDYSIVNKLLALLISLLVFYFLGSILKWVLDYFEKQNEELLNTEQEQQGQEEIQESEGAQG